MRRPGSGENPPLEVAITNFGNTNLDTTPISAEANGQIARDAMRKLE
jgi:hypothetical protein